MTPLWQSCDYTTVQRGVPDWCVAEVKGYNWSWISDLEQITFRRHKLNRESRRVKTVISCFMGCVKSRFTDIKLMISRFSSIKMAQSRFGRGSSRFCFYSQHSLSLITVTDATVCSLKDVGLLLTWVLAFQYFAFSPISPKKGLINVKFTTFCLWEGLFKHESLKWLFFLQLWQTEMFAGHLIHSWPSRPHHWHFSLPRAWIFVYLLYFDFLTFWQTLK